jgi:hypothetical protein
MKEGDEFGSPALALIQWVCSGLSAVGGERSSVVIRRPFSRPEYQCSLRYYPLANSARRLLALFLYTPP